MTTVHGRMIIDVREPEEYSQSHVEGATNIPTAKLLNGRHELETVPRDTEIIVYCRTGNRANAAQQILQQQGFTDVINGINERFVRSHY